MIASLVAIVWPQSFTPVNIMAGFKKCGNYPLNPGEVTDCHIAPSKMFASKQTTPVPQEDSSDESRVGALSASASVSFSDLEAVYRKRYEEGYDIYDAEYIVWLHHNHPESVPMMQITLFGFTIIIQNLFLNPKPRVVCL